MTQDVRTLVGICGLYCGTCPSYIANRENNVAELEKRSRELNIPVEDTRCQGCQSDRVMSLCVDCHTGFRRCAREHEVTWCFECSDFPCERLRNFRDIHIVDGVSHHARVIEDLQYMKEHGIEQWVAEQEKAGRCPHCGKNLYWFSRVCPDCQNGIK